jgi:hypothetical protein
VEQRDLTEYKRRYAASRHHAWAGTAFLSVLLALRYIVPQFPHYLFIPLCTLLILYIVVSLLYTFKYRQGLFAGEMPLRGPEEFKETKGEAKVDKARVKAEKKRAKAEAKARKKAG